MIWLSPEKRKLIRAVRVLFKGVKEFEAKWIGWAGVNVPDEIGQKALTKSLAEKVQISTHGFLFSCHS